MNTVLFEEANNDIASDPQEWFIKQKDGISLAGRVKRLKHLHKLNPDGKHLMGNVETTLAYKEMQWCYIEGFYLSVIVLAQSLIEKILQDRLSITAGVKGKDLITFSSMLKVIKKKKLLHEFWISKIDRIRTIRNPITHLRKMNDPNTVDHRSYNAGNHVEKQLELDAKDALEVATHFSLSGLNKIF
jgi:hypothetical protein